MLDGRKTEEQVLGEFLETFEQHHNLRNGRQADGRVTIDEFVEYYTNVSASIDNDMYFSQMMNQAWNLSGDATTYQKYEKGWTNDDGSGAKKWDKKPAGSRQMNAGYQANNKKVENVATQRSGLQSSDNPFGNMHGYYKNGGSPVRQSMANNKHIAEDTRTYN